MTKEETHMISGTNSINSLLSAAGANSGSSLNALTGASDFGSIFSQAAAQAKTPADSAKIDWLQAEYSDLTTLFSMGDSSPSSSMAGLFNLSGAFSTPAWETDLERLLGQNSTIQQLVGIQNQASMITQSMLNNDLSSLGSNVNSVL